METVKNKATEYLTSEMNETVVSEVISGISKDVQKKYKAINLLQVPDHVSYAKVEKYLRSVNIEITRKMFFSYLKDKLVPTEQEVKNRNYSFYTRDQIIYFIMIDMFKPILPLNKIKKLFNEILKQNILEYGLDFTYLSLCEMINYMINRLEEAVTKALKEEFSVHEMVLDTSKDIVNEKEKAVNHIAHHANLVTLCMAKGAIDFYKHSPFTLLD